MTCEHVKKYLRLLRGCNIKQQRQIFTFHLFFMFGAKRLSWTQKKNLWIEFAVKLPTKIICIFHNLSMWGHVIFKNRAFLSLKSVISSNFIKC